VEIFSTVLKFVGVLVLVALNGFFVAAEFAIIKVRGTQIEPLVRSGQKRARVAQVIITHLDSYLSATQLGITVASLGLGWLGEPFMAHLLVPLFVLAGIQQEAVIETISFALGFSLITFCTIVLGELVPKWLAIQRAQRIVLAVARPLHLFFLLFRPFIWLLNRSGTAFMSLTGIAPPSGGDIAHSEEELRLLLSKGRAFSSTGRNILLNALELQNRTVREVMVPRTHVVFLSTAKTIEENIGTALENQFTRYPLCEKSLDNIVGMIHLKDLFKLKGELGNGVRLLDIKREMLFVPETMPLERILNTFLAKRVLMAIAIDEYGGTAGLVTLENVLEELVGDIRDEFDVEPLPVQKVSDNEFLVDGTMPLHDFARMFDIRPDTKDVVTVSGYVIQILGKVPEKGTSFTVGSWSGTIESSDRRKVKMVRIRRSGVTREVVS
jgi:CBS domain containing-hemolysin-like protein